MLPVYIGSLIIVALILWWGHEEIKTINKTGHSNEYYFTEEMD